MQCEGITRAGRRCRNKALDDEIFCDTHLRVNQTYSLALLVPFLTLLLFGYFFLYGILFDTLVLGVFDLNYLKFAGLSDFFISMLRVGGLLTVLVIKLWLAYAVILAVGFGLALLVRMILLTSHLHIELTRRVRIIGLSLGIYMLNLLHLALLALPKKDPRRPARILVGREHLVRTLMAARRQSRPPVPLNVRDETARFFQRFLAVSTFNRHRFSVTLLALLVTSFLAVLYAGHEARRTRSCVIDAAATNIPDVPTPVGLPGFNISPLCSEGAEAETDVSIAGKFSDSLGGFFSYPAIVLATGDSRTPLAFLGATERFELFFNGATRLPFALPNQSIGALFTNPPVTRPVVDLTVRKKTAALERQLLKTNADLTALAKQVTTRQSDISDEDMLSRLDRKLSGLETEVRDIVLDRQQQSMRTLPPLCRSSDPQLVLEFPNGVSEVRGQRALAALSELVEGYLETGSSTIAVTGYSDPSGPALYNFRLSRERAVNVRDRLVAAGLNSAEILAIGYGEDDSTVYPRRRVEIRDCSPFL